MARHWLQRIGNLWASSRTSSHGGKRPRRGLRWRQLAGEPLEQRRLLTVFSVPIDSATIQGAINMAALDDPGAGHHTIHVAKGFYAENLTIPVNPFLAGLELIGDGVDPANPDNPLNSTIVQPALPAGGITLDILQGGSAGAPVAVSGFNFKSAGGAAGDWPVEILSGVDHVVLDSNWIDTRGPASQGVSLTGPNDHLVFSNNRFLFDENGGDVALDFNPESTNSAATDVQVDGNTFLPDAGTNIHRAMKFGNVANLAITGNTLGSRIGFHVGGGGVASQAIVISGNHFLAESRSGVFFLREGAGTFGAGPTLSDRLSIHDNDFSARDPGVYFYAAAADPVSLQAANFPAPVLIQHNNFHGYAAGQEAIRVGEPGSSLAITIDATDNWWGSADGPTAVGNTFNVATQGAAIANNGGAAIQYVTWWNSISGSAGGYAGTPFAPVHVGAKPFASIQAAIDDAATVAGNTVDIATGTYSETVQLTKSLALQTPLHTAVAEEWTSAPGTTTHLSGGYAAPATIAGSGIFKFDGAIVLDGDVILTSGNGGDISFNDTVDSQTATARTLELNTAGVTTFAGQVGGVHPLASVTTDAAGQTRFAIAVSPGIITTGNQTYNDVVQLALDTVLSSAGGGDIVIANTVDSQAAARALAVNTAGATQLLGAVGTIHALASLTTNAGGTTDINGGTVVTTGGQAYNDPVLLSADAVLASTAAGDINFNNTVDSQTATARALAVNTGGTTQFAGQVGGTHALASLATDAGGQTHLGTAASPDVVTTGGQTYNDTVRLALDTVLVSTAAGNIVFASTVDSQIATAHALTVNTAGTTQFAGQVGAATALAGLATDAGGQTLLGVIAAPDVVTTGGQTYGDAVRLAQDATLVSTAAGDIVFSGAVDSQAAARALAVNTAAATRLNGAVGGLNPLASLQTDAPGTTDINGGSVITTGGQAYNDPVLLSANTVLSSLGAGNIVFSSTLDSETAVARTLAVNTGGTTQFAGQVGGIHPLASLATDAGGQTILGVAASPDVITTGGQTYNDAVELALDTTLQSTAAGDITLGDTVDSQIATTRALGVNTAGDTRFAGQVGGLHPLLSITTDVGGQTIYAVAASPSATTTGDQTYGDALRLDLNTALYSNNNGNFQFAAVNSAAGALSTLTVTVDPAPAVSTSVGGEIAFAGVVGADVARRLGALTALGNGPLSIAAAVHTQGNVLLTVRDAEFPDGASNNAIDHRNRVALGAAGAIASDAGNITLQAGDSVVLPAGSNLSVIAPSVVTIEIGFADAGGRGLGEIAGAVSTLNAGTLAQTAVVVNGGTGHDRLVVRSTASLPKPGLVFDANGNGTGAAGDPDKDLLIVEGSADGDNFYVTDGNFDGSIQWARGYVAPANPPYFTAPLVVPPTPEVPQPKIQYKNIETLELDTLAGNDRVTFLMSANPSLRFRVDGGQPTPAPLLANFDAQYVDGVRFIGTSGNDTIAVGDFGSADRFQVNHVGILQAFGEDGADTIANDTATASIRMVQGGVPGTFAWLPAPVASLLVGGAGNDAITGGNNDDVLFGGAGVDTLSALQGSDFLFSDQDLSKDTYLATAVVPADNGDSLDGGIGLLAPTSVTVTGALQEEHDAAAYEGTDLLANIDIAAGHGGILDPWMWLTMRFSDTATLLDQGLSQPFARPFPPAPASVPMPLFAPKTLALKGTSGNDTLEFAAGVDAAHWTVKLNGKAIAVDPATVAVTFAGGAGTDTVKFTGAGGADQAELWPNEAVFRGDGYKLSVSQVEAIAMNGAGGDDSAVLHDSKWTDTLTASSQQTKLIGANGKNTVFSHSIVGVESVTVYADAGGKDAAIFNGASANDQFTGSRDSAQMKIGVATIVANGFESITAAAGRAGTGAAYLYDSAGNDTFTGRPGSAVLAGAGYSLTAKGFAKAIATASGGYDTADLFGSTGNDSLRADRDSTLLSGNGYSNLAKGFDEVHANGLGGTDTAQIVDGKLSAGKIARGNMALPTSLNQLAWLFAFEQIQKTDTTGGTTSTQKAAKDQVFTAYWQ